MRSWKYSDECINLEELNLVAKFIAQLPYIVQFASCKVVQNLWQVNKIKQLTSNIDRIYTQMSILLLIKRNCRVITSYLTFVILSTVYTRNTFAKWWTSFRGGKLSYWPRYNTLTATSFASVKFQGRHFLDKIVCQKGNVIAKTIIIASLVISLNC